MISFLLNVYFWTGAFFAGQFYAQNRKYSRLLLAVLVIALFWLPFLAAAQATDYLESRKAKP